MSEPIVYLAHDRPDVEVLWEGVWCPGEVCMVKWMASPSCTRSSTDVPAS